MEAVRLGIFGVKFRRINSLAYYAVKHVLPIWLRKGQDSP